MKNGMTAIAGIAMISTLLGFAAEAKEQSQMIMGYVSTYGLKEHNILGHLNPKLLTHLTYSFLDISPDGKCVVLNEDGDRFSNLNLLKEFRKTKLNLPELKTILSIGGWGNSAYFSDVASSSESRTIFAKSCIQYLQRYLFDGIDIDWEFPVKGGIDTNHMGAEDTKNQVLLIQEFRKQLDLKQISLERKLPYSLSIAVSGEKKQLETFDIKNLAPWVDWFGVMAYDMCSDYPCNHSSLYAYDDHHSYSDETIRSMRAQGAKSDQILLGVPFYGYKWRLVRGIRKREFVDYQSILRARSTYDHRFDQKLKQSLLISPDGKSIITYDDPKTLRHKARYARKHHLAGTLIWDLTYDTDDFSLLRALN
jgi:chitinase